MRKTIKLFALAILGMFVASSVYAQVTTSSMSGRVTEKDGSAVAGATVIATHTPSGTKYYSIQQPFLAMQMLRQAELT